MPFIRIKLGETKKEFDTKEELKTWLEEQKTKYSWWNDARNDLEKLLGRLDSLETDAIHEQLSSIWKKLHIPVPGSNFEHALDSLAKKHQSIAVHTTNALKQGRISGGPQDGQRSIDDILGNAYAMQILFPPHNLQHAIETAKSFEEHLKSLQAQTDTARQKIDQFLESVNLKPALKYWADKAVAHAKTAKRMMIWTFVATLGAVASFTGLLYVFSKFGWLHGQSGFLGLAGVPLTLFAAAVTLWMPRAAYKLAVMHNHLKEHADEKKAIVHTYLTLLEHDSEFKSEGRKALLEQLFQGGQTGLVNEKFAMPSILSEK